MSAPTLGTTVYTFFVEYLADQKGLRPTSIRSYRDALRLFLLFVAAEASGQSASCDWRTSPSSACWSFCSISKARAAITLSPGITG